MSLCIWRGDAQGIAQVDRVTVSEVEVGDTFTLTVNRKDVSFTATSTTTDHVYGGLASAIAAANLPEFPSATVIAATIDQASYLKLIGRGDGTPYTISGSTTNGGTGSVDIELVQTGTPGRNMKQRIALPVGISGGTFTLSWSGQTTTAIDYDATATEVDAALEALTNIGSGDVSVTGDPGGPWVVEFSGTLAASTQPPISGNGASLSGQAVSITQVQAGQSGSNYAGSFIVRYNSTDNYAAGIQVTGTDPYGNVRSTATYSFPYSYDTMWRNTLATALGVGNADIAVSVTDQSASSEYDVEFRIMFECVGQLAGRGNINLALLWLSDFSNITVTESDAGGNTSNEMQLVTLPGSPTGGTFTLTFQGQTTSGVPYDSSAASLQTTLEALSNIESGDVIVTAGSVGGWQIEFAESLGAQDLALLTASGTNLSGGTIATSTSQAAISPLNEKVLVTLGQEVSGGTFTLTHGDNTAGNIAFNATSDTIDAALEALAHLSSGDVHTSGDPGGPWIIEFTGNLAATDVGEVIANGDNLTGTSAQTITITSISASTGPYHWDNAENWSGGSVPVDNDTVVFERNANPVKYGLDQSSTTLDLLDVRASYTGTIGLPSENRSGNTPYIEYRLRSLQIGATNVRIGAGEGIGSERILLDLGDVQSTVTIHSTATPAAIGQHAVTFQGTHAANKLFVYQGFVGIAPNSGDTAVLNELHVGYETDATSDVELYVGDNVTLGDVVVHGGQVTTQGRSSTAITSLLVTAGEVTLLGTDGVNQLDIEGGIVFYRTTGTLGGNTIVSGDGRLSLTGDLRAKTITNAVTCRGDNALVEDPQQTASSLSIAYESTSRLPELGTTFTIARS